MRQIELKQVAKHFGDIEVIKPLDLQINDGEFVVFVGPSGCGKSTLLRLIAGLEDVTSGHILINGKDTTQLAPSDRGLAMVFQSYALYPHMTVRKNIDFPRRMAGLDKNERARRVQEAAKALNLTDYLERRPGQLSGGQRQGVAVARAAAFGSKVIILDEPTAALGVKESRKVLDLIQDVRAKGVPIILISHNMPHVFEVCDRVHIHRLGKRLTVIDPKKYEMADAVAFMTGAKEPNEKAA